MDLPTDLILVPYSLGREGAGMGAGPLALRADVEELLAPRAVIRVVLSAPFASEVGASACDPAHETHGGVRAALREVLAAVRS